MGRTVTVKLNSGVEYQGNSQKWISNSLGTLACLDGSMNIVLEQTEEIENGVVKTKYGEAFIRGNNGKLLIFYWQKVLYISSKTQKKV